MRDGIIRYFVWSDWRVETGPNYQSVLHFAAWISPTPTPHILAVEPKSNYLEKEQLLNVVDLGNGKTGVIVYIQGSASRGIELREYKDGSTLKGMRMIQAVGAGE